MPIKNIEQYSKLCKDCDKVLTQVKHNPILVANTYFHVLKAHPEILKKYQLLSIKQKLSFILIRLIRISQSFVNKKQYYTQQKLEKIDILMVSHLDNHKQIHQNDDIRFGDLSDQLFKKNINTSIAYINSIKISRSQDLSPWKNNQSVRFVLNTVLNFSKERNIYHLQKKAKKQLYSILENLKINQKFKKNALGHCLSSDTANAIRIAIQIAELAKKTQARFIITPYEGHSWERLVYYYARKSNPNIKCIAYQHAAVFEHQHALKRLLHDDYNPDIILTSGMIAQNTLKQCDGLKSIDISCLGSPKHQKPHKLATITQHCLVVPEGFISECLLLFELSLSYAKNNPKQCFIWRLHPLLSFKKLKKHSVLFNDLSDNITLSQQTLEQDIEQCDSVLYRGSTAVVNAINSGLTPIYYQQFNDELSIDPIYQQKAGKFIVKNQDELQKALTQNIDTDTQQKRQNFAQQFYTPLQAEVLINLIKSNENKQ